MIFKQNPKLLFVLLLPIFTSCGEQQPYDIADTHPLRSSINNADHVFVYEGLPHQYWEPDALQIELKRNDVSQHGGYPFYEPDIQADTEVAAHLKEIVASKQSPLA